MLWGAKATTGNNQFGCCSESEHLRRVSIRLGLYRSRVCCGSRVDDDLSLLHFGRLLSEFGSCVFHHLLDHVGDGARRCALHRTWGLLREKAQMSVNRLSVVRYGLAALVAGAGILASTSAMAQDASASASASTSTGVKASAKAPQVESAGDSDHDRFIGTFAVGYLGASTVPIGALTASGNGYTASGANVTAPIVGVRYWLNELVGIDAGLGFRHVSTSVTEHQYVNTGTQPYEGDVTYDMPSQTGFLIHAGVPLALAAEKHFTFEAIPEVNVGFASGTYKFQSHDILAPGQAAPTYPNDVSLSGMRLDVGGRIGAEIHFGFIGIPQLALQAGVGLYFSRTTYKVKGGGGTGNPAAPDTSSETKTTTIGTSLNGDPWAIFTNNISALYYF